MELSRVLLRLTLASIFLSLFLLLRPESSMGADDNTVHSFSIEINRRERTLSLFENGRLIRSARIGIGRGGVKDKKSMDDFVTPTGEFTVDLIVSRDGRFNRVSDDLRRKYAADPQFREFFTEPNGLARLFDNMSSLDFDGDRLPDHAYGTAYIGLNSDRAITGPKMRSFKGTPYWYSIAIHGTNHPDRDLGGANSGGCVHLDAGTLEDLVTKGFVTIGTKVIIKD